MFCMLIKCPRKLFFLNPMTDFVKRLWQCKHCGKKKILFQLVLNVPNKPWTTQHWFLTRMWVVHLGSRHQSLFHLSMVLCPIAFFTWTWALPKVPTGQVCLWSCLLSRKALWECFSSLMANWLWTSVAYLIIEQYTHKVMSLKKFPNTNYGLAMI